MRNDIKKSNTALSFVLLRYAQKVEHKSVLRLNLK
jgi:hypothetical protein